MVFLDIGYSLGGPEPFHLSGLHCITVLCVICAHVQVIGARSLVAVTSDDIAAYFSPMYDWL